PRAGGRAAAQRPARQGAIGLPASGGARSQQRARAGRARHAGAGGARVPGAGARRPGGAQGRQVEGARPGGRGRGRLRGPGRDEAIAELQKALRAPEGKLKSSEALGLCFIEKGAHVVAESILRRALELPASGDQERLAILYWLGRALEAQGKKAEAREVYGRAFAVDIRFMDVGERAKALARAK